MQHYVATDRSNGLSLSVLQLVDSLALAGTESVAVNLANELAIRGLVSHLCATRKGGPLEKRISHRVRYLSLNRRGRFDIRAIIRLREYVRDNSIQIIHAHGSSLFLATVVASATRDTRIIWHDHYGPCKRNPFPYQVAAKSIAHVISVNESLAQWAQQQLKIDKQRIHYLPNFVPRYKETEKIFLPGTSGSRIVCVAGLRPVKNHIALIDAMSNVCRYRPDTHLFLVGKEVDREYTTRLRKHISELQLNKNIHFWGEYADISNILNSVDIAVLSSDSEGFPLVLLEYGMAGLPVVCTNVGQCSEILDYGRAGLLVPPKSVGVLAEALLLLLNFKEKRQHFGQALFRRVQEHYNTDNVLNKIISIYQATTNR